MKNAKDVELVIFMIVNVVNDARNIHMIVFVAKFVEKWIVTHAVHGAENQKTNALDVTNVKNMTVFVANFVKNTQEIDAIVAKYVKQKINVQMIVVTIAKEQKKIVTNAMYVIIMIANAKLRNNLKTKLRMTI